MINNILPNTLLIWLLYSIINVLLYLLNNYKIVKFIEIEEYSTQTYIYNVIILLTSIISSIFMYKFINKYINLNNLIFITTILLIYIFIRFIVSLLLKLLYNKKSSKNSKWYSIKFYVLLYELFIIMASLLITLYMNHSYKSTEYYFYDIPDTYDDF